MAISFCPPSSRTAGPAWSPPQSNRASRGVLNVAMRLDAFILLWMVIRSLPCASSEILTQTEVLDVLEDADRFRSPREKTARPVIGILSLEVSPTVQKYCGEHDSYIAASYVKFVEGAGAQAAPILIGQSPEYYRDMVKRVNGLLLPGGATYFDGKANGYEAAGRELLRLAKELNEAGDYFPVLGICLGMELIAVEAAGEDLRESCTSESPRPHRFLLGSIRSSRLFGRAPASVVNILGRENATANHHSWCVTQRGLNSRGLHRDWRSLTTSDDDQGFEYVSIMEHRRQPVYGLMFHPEKSIYEWKRTKNYPHSATAVAANRYFADFLVSEARRNNHSFPAAEERSHLMYGHQPVDTKGKLMWEQLYFFDEEAS